MFFDIYLHIFKHMKKNGYEKIYIKILSKHNFFNSLIINYLNINVNIKLT